MFTYFINIWNKAYNILTMKKHEVWTDSCLQTEWTIAALYWSLYSPASWGIVTWLAYLTRLQRPRHDWPILNLAADDVIAPRLLIGQEFLTSDPWASPAVHYYSNSRQGRTWLSSGRNKVSYCSLFAFYTGDPRRTNGDLPSASHCNSYGDLFGRIMTSIIIIYSSNFKC